MWCMVVKRPPNASWRNGVPHDTPRHGARCPDATCPAWNQRPTGRPYCPSRAPTFRWPMTACIVARSQTRRRIMGRDHSSKRARNRQTPADSRPKVPPDRRHTNSSVHVRAVVVVVRRQANPGTIAPAHGRHDAIGFQSGTCPSRLATDRATRPGSPACPVRAVHGDRAHRTMRAAPAGPGIAERPGRQPAHRAGRWDGAPDRVPRATGLA